jgi:hypothetical protein
VRPLRHTVPPGAGETPASFVSRLAALHRTSAREMCLDMGTTFQKVVDGDPKALAIVAFKAGAHPDTLAGHAFVKTGERRHTFRGEELTRDDLRRAVVFVCPKCLAEDIAAAPRIRPRIAAFQRAPWQIAALKTCHIHLAPLVAADKDMTPSVMHDWSHHVAKVLPDLARLADDADTRALTRFETYVLDRINGGSTRGGPVDGLPLFVAIAACETFGAVATFGRMPNLKTLTDEQWRTAGAAGFDIVGAGKPGIEAFLEQLQATYPYARAGSEGPQALFGRIYQVLEFGREDPAFDPLRDLVGDFIRKRLPVGPGDTVFGKPVERRALHSIRTLSMETRLHPKRLRKLLKAAGTLPPGADALADGNCLFDAQQGSMAAREASAASLTLLKAGEYLNAPRVQRVLLHRAGFIVPRIRAGDHGAADMFAPADLERFLDRLLDGAVAVPAVGDGQATIPGAAKRACCGAETIVSLALEGKLSRKWRLAGEHGYMALLVHVEEVRRLVRGPDLGGLTRDAVTDRLHVSDKVTCNLIARGHLRTITAMHPVNRCPTVIVPKEEVARFEREFVSLFALAKSQGRHFLMVKKELHAAGVEPALDPAEIGATFYCRRQAEVFAMAS